MFKAKVNEPNFNKSAALFKMGCVKIFCKVQDGVQEMTDCDGKLMA